MVEMQELLAPKQPQHQIKQWQIWLDCSNKVVNNLVKIMWLIGVVPSMHNTSSLSWD